MKIPPKRSCPGIGLSYYSSNNGGVQTALRKHVGTFVFIIESLIDQNVRRQVT